MSSYENVFAQIKNIQSNQSNDEGSGGIIFVIILFLILVGGLVAAFFATRKKDDQGGGGSGDAAHGARSPAPAQALAVVPTDPSGDLTVGQVMAILQDLLVGVAAGEAAELIVKRTFNALKSTVKTLMQAELRATALRNLRPQNAARAIQRGWRKLMNFKFSNLSNFARTRFGLMWARRLAAAGETEASILAKLTLRFGGQRAAQIASRAAAQAAEKALPLGPVTAAELVITGVGMGLDMTNTGGYMSIDSRKTSDLLVQRKSAEAIQKNSYIQGPPKDDGTPDASQAIGYYPAYWGPLDEMNATQDADGLDYVDVLVETKMFEMLFADDPDPFMLKLLDHLARRYDVATGDIQGALEATMLTDMTQEDYWGLYDRAFDSVCTSNGGALVDPGGGHPKQCSHVSESRCHAFSPWIDHVGPQVDPDVNYTYAEWRNADFFNQNYKPAVLPAGAAGACIVQDPSIHALCDNDPVCTSSGCGYNEYVRNMGVCQNTSQVCNKAGVSTCQHMRKIGGSGDPCGTGANGSSADLGPDSSILPGNTTLRSCYVDSGQYWAEMLLPTGSSIYRWFASGGPAALDQSIVNSMASGPGCPCGGATDKFACMANNPQCTGSGVNAQGHYVANWGWTGGSDARLKTKLKKTGRKIGTLDEYTWEWNDIALSLNINDPTIGVLAQEALVNYPEAVFTGSHGYYMINYKLLLSLVYKMRQI